MSGARPTNGQCWCAGFSSNRGAASTAIAVCSTVPAVLHEWRDMLARHFEGIRSVVVEPGVRTGVPVLMDNPA